MPGCLEHIGIIGSSNIACGKDRRQAAGTASVAVAVVAAAASASK